MNTATCPVAELGRLMYVQFDALADAGRDDDEDARKAAHAWVGALGAALTTVQATSWRGVALQLNELRTIDGDLFGDPDIAAAIKKSRRANKVQTKMRLIDLIGRAVATLAPESRIARDAEGRPA
jgi:hypothetical protein